VPGGHGEEGLGAAGAILTLAGGFDKAR